MDDRDANAMSSADHDRSSEVVQACPSCGAPLQHILHSDVGHFDEIRLAGAQSPQVTRRVTEALDDLETVAPPERLAVLQVQRDLLRAALEDVVVDVRDAAFALVSDRQGIGVAAGTATNGSRVEPTADEPGSSRAE
jgi:hypothetical protein